MATPSTHVEQIFTPPLAPSTAAKWWSEESVAVVTGANKGIGYALVRRLAELGLTVVLTARDWSRGLKAMDSLRLRGLDRNVHFCLLDVSDPPSIASFVSWFRSKFDALDILINNAAVCFNVINENSIQDAESVLKTNYYGSKALIKAVMPLFRHSPSVSRILNISSRLGLLDKLKNTEMKELLGNEEKLTEERIEKAVSVFLEDVKNGRWQRQGWPEIWTDYSVSKLALNAYSKLLARRRRDVSVNCLCPGVTQTAMTDGKGKHSADEAANMAAALALFPPHLLTTGKFYAGSTRRGLCAKL